MLFHTWLFAAFFVIAYTVYLALRKSRFRIHWLLLVSYFFYAGWNPLYLPLIVFSTVVDYVAVVYMERSGRRKLWLWISLINNLGLLVFFKYSGFFTANLNEMLTWLGTEFTLPNPADRTWKFGADLLNPLLEAAGWNYRIPHEAVLPVGISFYTFQSMSYTIDFYRGRIERERNFIKFAAYVAFFPQLVAGPIERAKHLLPQLSSEPRIKLQNVTEGLSLFIVGLFKKIALADYLALYVDEAYANPSGQSAPVLLFATFAFAWQIYFDFSGYTDMARGIGRAMGFDFMLNFNNPYLATGLSDFWARWHISLSTWFRDYVYVPLGGNRGGAFSLYRNLFITFVISGLWHGAGWTFIIWGALHALGTMVTRRLERWETYKQKVPRICKQIMVFGFVCFAWIFFRAQNLNDAWDIIATIATGAWTDPRFPVLALGLTMSIWVYQWLYESRARQILQKPYVKIVLVVLMIVYLCLVPGSQGKPFIYFNF